MDSKSDHQLTRTAEDFRELATMLQNLVLLYAHTFGETKAERVAIYYLSRIGRYLSDLRDELHNLATPVKSEILVPVDEPIPRNTNHPSHDAIKFVVLNACAALMHHHTSKRACFREVSKLLKKHATYRKAGTIAQIWYATAQDIRKEGPPDERNLYADWVIVFGRPDSTRGVQATHRETTKMVERIMNDVLPGIPADLRDKRTRGHSPPTSGRTT